ncbi:MAG: Trm112 family protein [Planctomycetota bacterium]
MNKVDEELLRIMVCPVAHAPLVQVGDWLYSTDSQTRRKYPVRDGIPIMLVDESQVADAEEFKRVMAEAKAAEAPTTQSTTTKH